MKRWIGSLTALCLAGLALAQAPFTIVRPAEGAKVREKVRVLVPKNSVPEGGYVGVYVDGKFVEATILDVKGDYYEYNLDTKASKIPDGQHKIELVLYAEAGDRARILDRSSVNVTVSNVASIPVPDEGMVLRYAWRRGSEHVYNCTVKASILTISEAQARAGGRAAELPVDTDTFRLLYAVDNSYTDGDGLLRMQALPNRGKDYVFFKLFRTAEGDLEEGRRYYDYEMHPVYMRVTNTGFEKFGAVPFYFPMEGTGGEPIRTDLYAVFPLPTLPTKAVKPGDPWQGRVQLGTLDLDRLHETKEITAKVPARGEFVGVEWEMGRPCAKIRYSIAQAMVPARAGQDGRQGMGGERVSIDQVMWFALDRRIPVRIDTDFTIDTRTSEAAAATGGFGGGGAGNQGGRRAGPEGAGTGDLGGAGVGVMGQGAPPQASGATSGQGRMPGGRQGAPGGGAAQTQYVRLRYKLSLTLEQ